jgi:hypothetical protein
VKRIALGLAAVLLAMAAASCGSSTSSSESKGSTTSSESGSTSTSTSASESNIAVVKRTSFCLATGVSDVYTGEGRVTFYISLRNTGGKADSFDVQPIRHYDDGSVNNSPADELHVDSVPAHGTWKGRSQPFKYKAHEHEIVGCGLDPSNDLGEQRIRVVR